MSPVALSVRVSPVALKVLTPNACQAADRERIGVINTLLVCGCNTCPDNSRPSMRGAMKHQTRITRASGLTLLLASAVFAQHVKTDYDRSADFSQYKTYSWENVKTKDSLWVDR